VLGPVGGAASPELVAAVANAGGLGLFPIYTRSADVAVGQIKRTQHLTDGAIGVNLRADMVQLDHVRAAIDADVRIFHLFWGDPSPFMEVIKASEARTLVTVGDSVAARMALDAGADGLVAQGVEAGGHVLGETPLKQLLDSVVPLAGEVPVIAAGGLADTDDVSAVMALGASGVVLGTRFVATKESAAHQLYKEALLAAGADSTVRTQCFDGGWPNAPHRVLRNSTFDVWTDAGQPPSGKRPGEGDVVLQAGSLQFVRYSAMHPMEGMTGDIEAACMYAGMGVGRIRDCPSAAEVMADLKKGLPGN